MDNNRKLQYEPPVQEVIEVKIEGLIWATFRML